MLTLSKHIAEDQAVVSAPVEVVRGLIMDVVGWTQLHDPAVHSEYLERGKNEDLTQQWSVVDDHTVRSWTARRWVREQGREIIFAHEPAKPPFADVRGGWTLRPQADGSTLVTMHHEFTLLKEGTELAARMVESMRHGSSSYLETLKYAAENREELARLIISFEDPLFISGSVEDVYTYLYEADKWPERIPHVARLDMTEEVPNIQFFDMDTVSSDGSRHTTRSVRICRPHNKIVYKQIQPPKTMVAHTGHWKFTETPEGVIASARHSATIKPEGLHLLGEGTTVEGARRYLRRILSANSMGNLRLAKAYAEERASH